MELPLQLASLRGACHSSAVMRHHGRLSEWRTVCKSCVCVGRNRQEIERFKDGKGKKVAGNPEADKSPCCARCYNTNLALQI